MFIVVHLNPIKELLSYKMAYECALNGSVLIYSHPMSLLGPKLFGVFGECVWLLALVGPLIMEEA